MFTKVHFRAFFIIRGGGHTRLQEWGWGGPSSNEGERHCGTLSTVIWGNTGRVINFKVILKIVRKGFWEFLFHIKIHKLLYFKYQSHF
jgi:hypothetical protein